MSAYKLLSDRVREIEDWMESCQRYIQKPVEETLTEKNAEARFGKTILELANEQLRSDSNHAENTINSLKYQNKQGVNIRKDLEVQLRDRNALVLEHHDRIEKQLKTMTEQAGTIDRLERLAKKHADTIQRYVAHLDDADSVIEDQIKAIAVLKDNIIKPNNEVHILVYKYTTQYQCQVAGVFSSRDLMEDWLKENPAARDEETEVYTYTINEGEL